MFWYISKIYRRFETPEALFMLFFLFNFLHFVKVSKSMSNDNIGHADEKCEMTWDDALG